MSESENKSENVELLPVLASTQEEFFPELGLMEAAQAWESKGLPEVTGRIVLKDHERISRLMDMVIYGESERAIAEKLGMGRNTVRKVKDILTERGKLEPQKKRISRRLGHVAEALTEDLLRDVESNALPAHVKPIALGILLDKKALLDGEPSQVIEVRRDGLSIESVKAAWEALERRTIDVESGVLPQNAGEIGGAS
jgi:transposase